MTAQAQDDDMHRDPMEEVTKYIPWVVPLAGAIVIFLLAFVAVTMA